MIYFRENSNTHFKEQSISDIPLSCSAALPTVCSSFTNFASIGSNNFAYEQPVTEIKHMKHNCVENTIVEYLSAKEKRLNLFSFAVVLNWRM